MLTDLIPQNSDLVSCSMQEVLGVGYMHLGSKKSVKVFFFCFYDRNLFGVYSGLYYYDFDLASKLNKIRRVA